MFKTRQIAWSSIKYSISLPGSQQHLPTTDKSSPQRNSENKREDFDKREISLEQQCENGV